ncbi:Ada metal-binding domain-containing protein [Piscinibacter koreensis]|uniref:DNA-3-methyladenine glycosylase II n=1 Tax=Piscinibacter koreensis TaxID=2742824 RepID=A0A7Y6TVJ9_9BURK|nr:Ada metal-binding domain-containing protein [Schlegelella koreensis]NUZ05120.1 helix-turn-helix domain-containing protein [Schlegelella koreensis]
MTLDDDSAYRALLARDARFDGHWFVGVTSTGVYCRPICRVRTPLRRNCRFFDSAAQAEAAAFRPCLKCRPELAPGHRPAWSVMDASQTLARQAADTLDAADPDDGAPSMAALAARLGVSDRHLRRIFAAEHGVTPLQYLQTRRLLLAKQLLTDTALPVADVALASGFNSLRRFNAAFAERYRMQPTRLRHSAAAPSEAPTAGVTIRLAYRPPYDVAGVLGFVAARAIAGVETVTGRTIRRTLRAGAVDAAPGWIEVAFAADAGALRVTFAPTLRPARVAAMVRRWLDLDAAPAIIDAALDGLGGASGTRLPGCPDPFELAVRAVLGQQVRVAAARTLARRLVERFGSDLATPWPGVVRAFPAPASVAAAGRDGVASLGVIGTRAATIVDLARRWAEIEPLFAPSARPEPLLTALRETSGVGAWTANYIAMRGLGWTDAFPPGDVAALKALRARFGDAPPRVLEAHADVWRPWRAYALMRLWNPGEETR